MKSSEFRDLKVWQKAMDLAEEVYILVKYLPREETYSLSDKCVEPLYLFHQISRKAKVGSQPKNSFGFFPWLVGHFGNYLHK